MLKLAVLESQQTIHPYSIPLAKTFKKCEMHTSQTVISEKVFITYAALGNK